VAECCGQGNKLSNSIKGSGSSLMTDMGECQHVILTASFPNTSGHFEECKRAHN
jgi:hypothetical protein